MLKIRVLLFILFLYPLSILAASSQTLPSVDSFFTKQTASGYNLSPDGKHLAITNNSGFGPSVLVIDTLGKRPPDTIKFSDVKHINWVSWATDNRMLISMTMEASVRLPAGYVSVSQDGDRSRNLQGVRYARIMAIDRTGKNAVGMLSNAKRQMKSNIDLTRVTSVLPNDPDHILVPVAQKSLTLYKVNIHTGEAKKIERGSRTTYAWDVDQQGYPIARYDYSSSRRFVRIFTRAPGQKKWEKLAIVRQEDLKKFSPVGTTDDPGIIYVSAAPDGYDKAGLFRYDLSEKKFLDNVAAHDDVDIYSALIDAAGNYIGSGFYEDRLTYKFADPALDTHLNFVNDYFEDDHNVVINEVSANGEKWLLFVTGPQQRGSYYLYDLSRRKVDFAGGTNSGRNSKSIGETEAITYKARDGQMINAYLTHPANKNHGAAPLIVLPHGGPEVRDIYGFDPMVQFLASRGYRVFQPNFRGSAGYGKTFAKAGYGEWGGLMQDDITDGVNHLIKTGKAQSGNICIAGVSYGGYAALMGAVKTSELYQCAVSINGISDLKAMIDYDKDFYGKDSEVYAYVKKQMGDPKKDADRIRATSPITHAANLNLPLLIIHGEKDKVVPVKQSQAMIKALKVNGKSVTYVELQGVNHNLRGYSDAMYGPESTVSADWSYGYKKALTEMESFFAQHLK